MKNIGIKFLIIFICLMICGCSRANNEKQPESTNKSIDTNNLETTDLLNTPSIQIESTKTTNIPKENSQEKAPPI